MKPFVEPEIKTPYEGVRSLVYELGDENETILMVSEVEPYTEVPVHQHEDVQIGLVLEGAMEIVIEGVSSQLTALQDAYWVPSNVPHSAKNTTSNVIRTLDIKRRKTALDDARRSEEHTSELQSRPHLVCRLLLDEQKCRKSSVARYM